MSFTSGTRRYFVDEAGDATLFAARGQVIVGTEGCSSYLLLGARIYYTQKKPLTLAALDDLPGI